MGAGKSTIGRILADTLNLDFKDSDHLIEERTGADIPWIFDMEGEEGFRNRETAMLEELLELNNVVIATGGGVVMREHNRNLLKKNGGVVYLTADIDLLVARTARDKKRPLLQVEDRRQQVVDLFNLRDPLYREVATWVVKTDKRNPKLVADEIVRLVTKDMEG